LSSALLFHDKAMGAVAVLGEGAEWDSTSELLWPLA